MVIRYAPVETGRRLRSRGPLLAPDADRMPLAIRFAGFGSGLMASLRRARIALLLAVVLPLVGAAVFMGLRPSVYRASATVFIDPQASRAGSVADAGVLAAQTRLAGSQTVLANAIGREKLNDDSGFVTEPTRIMALLRRVGALVGIERFLPGEDRAAAVMRVVSGAVVARPGEGANLIEVSASLGAPAHAMRVANAVAQSLVDEIVASADSATGSERARVTRRVDDLKTRMKEAETRLSQYRTQHGIDENGRSAQQQDSDAVMQLARVRLASAEAKARYEQMQKVVAGGKDAEVIADLVRSPSVERLKAQYTETAAQETNLRTSLGPRHPAYLEALQNAREKKRLLQEGLRLAVSAARVEWQAAREQEIALEKRVTAEQPQQPQTAPQSPTQLRELEREVDIARAAYERYVRVLDGREEPASNPAARIVAPATAPLSSSSEGRFAVWRTAALVSCALALLVGLVSVLRGLKLPADAAPTVRRAPAPALNLDIEQDQLSRTAPRAVVRRSSRSPESAPVAPPVGELTTVDTIARTFAGRMEEFPLQTVFVTGIDTARAGAALDLARAALALQMRVLLVDSDEPESVLTNLHGNGAVLGTVALQGRARPLLLVEMAGVHRICLIPVEERAAVTAPRNARSLGGIAANFDVVIIAGPALNGALSERKLARAAQFVVLAQSEAATDPSEVARRLGVEPDVVQSVLAAPVGPSKPERGQPGVIRLRRVA